ncbi:hypothetical protein B0I00_2750 [Novosphingobium kunmingense]|uniref:DUF4365 domain-containing protein n=1 Tax=Novosphingobium kunmingense TaxID=1211806 RepID=A0A2N0H597_9SPHN|nr:hypothetical protein [Novosphingobium kunmingense]PKB14121.1 hypothetical protein B0I00_2750 [Novosphingobium kunmingense]
MSDIVRDLTGASLSTAREKVLEHRLLSELAVIMLQRGVSLDILRSEYDTQGHDVVLEAGGIIRHVQLKASREGGKRRHVDISVRLRARPSGCVVWMSYDPATLAIAALRWFGDAPGEPLPELGSKVTRHSKGDSAGTKSQRPALRNVGIAKFERLDGLGALAERLFGRPVGEITSHVITQLRRQFGQSWRSRLSAELRGASFWDSIHWAHLIDGYALLEQGLELDPAAWLEVRAEKGRAGKFASEAGGLWTQLFLEHRRWRFASPHEPDHDELCYLDDLAARTARAIALQILEQAD